MKNKNNDSEKVVFTTIGEGRNNFHLLDKSCNTPTKKAEWRGRFSDKFKDFNI